MRTTVDLPDELLRQAKSQAALDGIKLKDLITKCVEEGLRSGVGLSRAGTAPVRTALPVIIPARGIPIPSVSPRELRRIEEEEDEAKHDRST